MTGPEIARLRDLVSLGMDLRQGDDRAPRADVRQTLKAMAQAQDEDLSKSLDNCDEQAREEIAAAMCESTSVQEAAAKAHERLGPGSPGAPGKWYQREVARRIHTLWHDLAEAPGRVWSYDTSGSAAVEFAQAILSLVEGREFDLRKTVRLMLEVTRG